MKIFGGYGKRKNLRFPTLSKNNLRAILNVNERWREIMKKECRDIEPCKVRKFLAMGVAKRNPCTFALPGLIEVQPWIIFYGQVDVNERWLECWLETTKCG